ncbi:hypothetical protein [Streptomyces sp. NPDC046161]|uniref:hypothetical protein n=1 Tax=Streptomyces sp. NPDC046161 TaxID=3155132 RepID=UPI0033F476F0
MGNSGGSLVVRSAARRLPGLMAAAGFTGVEASAPAVAGWRSAEFEEAGRRGVARLARLVDAPVVAVEFLDSDVGFVEATAPDGHRWRALLDRAKAVDYGIPVHEFPVLPAVCAALAWSAAAGLTADEAAVRRALTESAVFTEHLAQDLFAGLGIPQPESSGR